MDKALFKFGQSIEVCQILMGCAPGYGQPMAAFTSGYRFLRYEENCVILAKRFLGSWIRVRHRIHDVRPVNPKNKPKVYSLFPVY